MKRAKDLVEVWFKKWTAGDFLNLPIADEFSHTSPYGVINGKQNYLELVNANKDQFLGYEFIIHDGIYEDDKACVRYTANHGDFVLEVTEWHYIVNDEINQIVSYYNIESEIPEERQLKSPN